MPRSFLIANQRYGSAKCSKQFNKNPINDQCSLVKISSNHIVKHSQPLDHVDRPIDQFKKLTLDQDQMLEQCKRIVSDQDQDQDQDQDTDCKILQSTIVDRTDLGNLKVIINFTPPGTPFQQCDSIGRGMLTSSVNSISSNGSNSPEIHVCSDCGKSYSTSSNLTRHRQTHRSVTDKKARKCPHCDKIYVSMPAYSMHVRTHTQGCQCSFCGKCFSRPWLLQGHIRTHTGEKPFKCHICNKAFADKSNLRAHVQTHSLTKPFVCDRCGKAFALKSYLYKHEESSCMRMQRDSVRLKHHY